MLVHLKHNPLSSCHRVILNLFQNLLFKFFDLQPRKDNSCIEWLSDPLLHLSQKIFFKCYLGKVHPLALLCPCNISRRQLRYCDECNACVSQISKTYGIPCGPCGSGSPFYGGFYIAIGWS